MEKTRALKDLACVKLQNAVTEIETDGDKISIADALDHVREVKDVLQMLLVTMDGRDNEPVAGERSG